MKSKNQGKRILLLFNTPSLGGGERSFVAQMESLKALDPLLEFIACIPTIAGNEDHNRLQEYLFKRLGTIPVLSFPYPRHLYSLSRSGQHAGLKLLFLLFDVPKTIFNTLPALFKIRPGEFDVVWANGNKIGFIFFIFLFLTGFKHKFIWHFRDYPETSGRFSLIWKLFKRDFSMQLYLFGNSNSMCEVLEKIKGKAKVQRFYNPLGKDFVAIKKSQQYEQISQEVKVGIVSMLAPWKGLHTIFMAIALWQERFQAQKNGIKFHIFGENIYKTSGAHSNYQEQLEQLAKKLGIEDYIVWRGNCTPSQIFSQIDLLIHASLRPEPFGRVILEAMASSVPVISTGLGGAREMLVCQGQLAGSIVPAYHYQQLCNAIEELIFNTDLRMQRLEQGKVSFQKIAEEFDRDASAILKVIS